MKKKISIYLLLAIMAMCAHAQLVSAQEKIPDIKFDNVTLKGDMVMRIIERKTKMLGDYLSVLCAKTSPSPAAVINQGMALFNGDETKIVSISTAKSDKIIKKNIRPYFVSVSQLPYKNVEVKYRGYQVLNAVHKMPNGTYQGTVVLEQEFTAFDSEGKPRYQDVTRKNIEVVIKINDYIKDGKQISMIDIFFGNMGVMDTRA